MINRNFLYPEDPDQESWAVHDEELQKRFGKKPLYGSWWKGLLQPSVTSDKTLSPEEVGNYVYANGVQVPKTDTGNWGLEMWKNSANPLNPSRMPVVPDTLSGFGEGFKQYGKRWKNDMSYNWGRVQRWWNDEELTKQGFSSILPEWNYWKELHPSDWESALKRMEEEYDTVKKNAEEDSWQRDRKDWLEGRINALGKMVEMRKNSYSPEQIEAEIKNWSEKGGPGIQRMKAALREEDRELKPTKGWATVGDVAAGVAQNMVPIAAGVAFPPAAPALGALNVGSLAAQNYAQAHKKVDRYEEMNDIKVPEVERMSYALLSTGLDFALQTLMQGRYLGNMVTPAKRALTSHALEQLQSNPGARREMTDLIKRYTSNLNKETLKGLIKDIALEGSTESLSSVGRDMAEMLYLHQEDYPELSYIFNNALSSGMSGMAMGSVFGGASRLGQRWLNNRRQQFKGLVSVGDWDGEPVEITGENDRGMLDILLPNGRIKTVAPDEVKNIHTVDSDLLGNRPSTQTGLYPYDPRERKTKNNYRTDEFLYRDPDRFWQALEEGEFDSPDHPMTPEERHRKRIELEKILDEKMPVKPGETGSRELNPKMIFHLLSKYTKYPKNELKAYAQDFLKKMKLDVDIYDTIEDIPSLDKFLMNKGGYAGFLSPISGRSAIILENIDSPQELEKVILHEKIGHEGIRVVLGEKANQFYEDLFYSMPPDDQVSYLREYGSQIKAADEYLAHTFSTLNPDPTFWDTFKANFRDAIRKRLGHDIRFSDEDLRYLIWKAKNRVQAGDSLEEMLKKRESDALIDSRFINDKRVLKNYDFEEEYGIKKRGRKRK